MAYTKEDVARARRRGDVSPQGVAFDWWLVNSDGAGFCLLREPHHTDEQIKQASAWLRRERDVVKLRVERIEQPPDLGGKQNES